MPPTSRLAEEAAALLAGIPARPPRRKRSLDDNREGLVSAAQMHFGEQVPVAQVVDLVIEGRTLIPVRLYHPRPGEVLPVVVYAHGGGWVLGDLETHDRLCRALVEVSQCAFISVDYRRAPERPFPAAWHDMQDVLREVMSAPGTFGVDPSRVVLAGDSAGGQLAAATALWARDERLPVRHVALLMPDVDNHPEHWPSHHEFDEQYGLYPDDQIWYYEQYFGNGWRSCTGPGVAPLHEDLRGLPSMTILLAECDPVHDEGAAFARTLAEAGVEVDVLDFPGMFHPFILFRDLSAARQAEIAIGSCIGEAVRP